MRLNLIMFTIMIVQMLACAMIFQRYDLLEAVNTKVSEKMIMYKNELYLTGNKLEECLR